MKKLIPVVLFLLILLLAIGGGIYYHFSRKTKENDGYVNGNTPGNLYNEGLICEYDGIIYFANPSDGDKLYSMNASGGSLTKLSDDIVSYINADENYLYYVRNNVGGGGVFSFLNINTNSLCRMDRTSGRGRESVLVLDVDACLYASLVGNYVYYLHYDKETATTLYKVKIDGEERQKVSDSPIFTCCAIGQYIYHNGTDIDHYIWRMDTAHEDAVGMLYGVNCWMPIVTEDESTAWFIDCDNGYKLARVDLETEEKVLLTKDRIDWYNLCGDYIYYQKSDREHPAICRMNADGSDVEVLMEGNYRNLCAASSFVTFREYTYGDAYYIENTPGAKVMPFDPGIAAED